MAKIYEEILVIKLSKLTKDGTSDVPCADAAVLEALETIVQELVSKDIIVEVELTN